MNWSIPVLLSCGLTLSLGVGQVVANAPDEIGTTGQTRQRLRLSCVLGEHATDAGLVEWLASRGWVWGAEIVPGTPDDAVRRLAARGWHVVADLQTHPHTRRRQAEYLGRSVVDPHREIERLSALTNGKVVWQFLMEDDSAGVGFPQVMLAERPASHAQAEALLIRYIQEAASQAEAPVEIQRWAVAGFAPSMHPFAATRADCVILERANDDVDDLQTGIAFARGAARQYGKQWGIDLSLWWGAIYGCVHDLPASLFKRHLFISYFSGARTFRIEGGDLMRRPGSQQPTRIEQAIAGFARLCRGLDPGEPTVPVAVVLPADHGWMTPAYWRTTNEAWNFARIQYRPGEKAVDGFFSYVFPGSRFAMDPFPFGAYRVDDPPASPFALSCITPRFAPDAASFYSATPPIPFGRFEGREEARRCFYEYEEDPSVYRAMGDSRWGDIFDILTEDVDAAVLRQYKAIILLGHLSLTDHLIRGLRDHVEGGGILVCAAGVVGPGQSELTGLQVVPELRVGRSWRWSTGEGTHEPYRYLPSRDVDGQEVEAFARTASGEPLVVRRRLGRGCVWTCLVPWFEGGDSGICGPARRMWDTILAELSPVQVDGLPVEWVSTKNGNDTWVVIANHDGTPWRGQVRIRTSAMPHKCRELLTGGEIEIGKDAEQVIFLSSVPGYDVRAYQLTD